MVSEVQLLGALVAVALVLLVVFWRRRRSDLPESGTRLPPAHERSPRGLRLLDGSEPDESHHVVLPSISPPENLVIGDNPLAVEHVTSPPSVRHDESWALARSLRKSTHPRSRRRRRRTATLMILTLVVLGVLTWWLWPGGASTAPGALLPLGLIVSR